MTPYIYRLGVCMSRPYKGESTCHTTVTHVEDLRAAETTQEARAALVHVVRTCRDEGVQALRDFVCAEEPVFYVVSNDVKLVHGQ